MRSSSKPLSHSAAIDRGESVIRARIATRPPRRQPALEALLLLADQLALAEPLLAAVLPTGPDQLPVWIAGDPQRRLWSPGHQTGWSTGTSRIRRSVRAGTTRASPSREHHAAGSAGATPPRSRSRPSNRSLEPAGRPSLHGPRVGRVAPRFGIRWPIAVVLLLGGAQTHRLLPARTTRPSTGPVRTCIGCRERAAKSELLRVVAGSDADGQPAVVPDPDGTAPGRGAHLHPTPECFDLAVRRRAFARALRLGHGARQRTGGRLPRLAARPTMIDRQKLEQQLMSTR